MQRKSVVIRNGSAVKVDEQEEFEFRLRREREQTATVPAPNISAAERVANDPISRGAREVLETTPADLIAANPVTRLFTGAASPILGASQILEEAIFGTTGGRERARQLEEMQATGNRAVDMSLSGGAADIAGTMVSPPFLAAAKMAPAASYAGRIGQGVALGAAAGAMIPRTEEGSRLPSTAAGVAVGGAVPAVAPAVTATGKGGYHALIEPWMNNAAIKGRAFLEAAGDKADDIIKLLRRDKELVPGARPTAGEAAVPAGRAEFSALQKSAERVAPSAYLARGDEQNVARINTLRTVGQGKIPRSLEEDIARRGSVAAIDYGLARQELVKSDGMLKTLLDRPSMDKAMARAAELAKEQNVPFIFGRDMPARTKEVSALGAGGVPTIETVSIPAQSSVLPVHSLHNIKLALDDMVKNPERFGIGASEVGAIRNTQKHFVSWLENRVPQYATARGNYAILSKPINQKDIGKFLEEKLVPALSDDAKQRASVYAQAIRDAPLTIKRATGEPRFESLEKALTPEQMKAVNSVRDDLARGARFETTATKGGQAAPNALDIASASMEKEAGGKLPNLLHRGAMVANAIISRVEGKINRKLAAEIASEMLNPPGVAETMAQTLARQKRNAEFADAITRYRSTAVMGAVQSVPQQREPARGPQ